MVGGNSDPLDRRVKLFPRISGAELRDKCVQLIQGLRVQLDAAPAQFQRLRPRSAIRPVDRHGYCAADWQAHDKASATQAAYLPLHGQRLPGERVNGVSNDRRFRS